MRNFGTILLLLGMLGFFYASHRASEAAPVPGGLTLRETLDQPGGRWELAKWGAATAIGVGALLALFPKGR